MMMMSIPPTGGISMGIEGRIDWLEEMVEANTEMIRAQNTALLELGVAMVALAKKLEAMQ